jgi:ribosomal protein S18 acetylase RimI-like enzyme
MWEIERLFQGEAERAGETLARAFYNDPLAVYMVPNPADRLRQLPWHFATLVRYGALFGEAYATSQNLRGVAVWLRPGEGEMTPGRISAAGMDQAPVVLGTSAWDRFMGVMEFMEGLRAVDMPEDHWYLAAIGVDPEVAGRGLGSALLRPVLAAADAQGVPCYLETVAAQNKAFYERHGFVKVRHGVESISGVSYWTFRREPP